jgi:hypothetical protein
MYAVVDVGGGGWGWLLWGGGDFAFLIFRVSLGHPQFALHNTKLTFSIL